MGWLDFATFGFYFVIVVAVGWYFSRRQESIGDYFLGGRNMPWLAVCLSIFATDLSAISYMGTPGWIFSNDLKYLVGGIFYPVIMLLALMIFIPILYRLNVYTVFEYLERRFNHVVRAAVSLLFMASKCVWLGAIIYAPALILVFVLGVEGDKSLTSTYMCIVGIGIVAIAYTVMGGMKAVIWTDVLQFIVLFAGMVVIFCQAMTAFGWDFANMWTMAGTRISEHTGGPVTVFYDGRFDLSTEATIWAVLAFYFIANVGNYGTNQIVVQRYFTIRKFRDITKAVLVNGFNTLVVLFILAVCGLALIALHQQDPTLFAGMNGKADRLIPVYVMNNMMPGLKGLIVAAIFAAAMSSFDSAIHSLSTCTIVDFYRRYLHNDSKDEGHYLVVARWLTLLWGILGIVIGIYVAKVANDSTILKVLGKLISFVTAPTIAIFLLGLFSRRANVFGALVGCVLSILSVVVMSDPILLASVINVCGDYILFITTKVDAVFGSGAGAFTPTDWVAAFGLNTTINWMWHIPISTVLCMVLGYLASFASPAYTGQRAKDVVQLTLASVYGKARKSHNDREEAEW